MSKSEDTIESVSTNNNQNTTNKRASTIINLNNENSKNSEVTASRHSILVSHNKAPKRKHVHFALDFGRNFYNLVTVMKIGKFWNRKVSVEGFNGTDGAVVKKKEEANVKQKRFYVIDPSQNLYYVWLIIISISVMYNYVFVIGRTAFNLLQTQYFALWIVLDYSCDILYLFDILVHLRTGYLEQGLLETDNKKLATHYIKSLQFKIDILSLLPFDLLAIYYTSLQPVCRFNRLLKLNRIFEFRLKSETRTRSPYLFRIVFLFTLTLVLIHWNSCFYYLISKAIGFGADGFVLNATSILNNSTDLFADYTACFYWATLVLTTIAEISDPTSNLEAFIIIADLLIAIVLFASIIGNIGAMIENMNSEANKFHDKVDAIKSYMRLRKVSPELDQKIVKWFEYRWINKQSVDESEILSKLSNKLYSEIAINAHLAAIKKVNIFSDCEPSFLEELVTKLKLQVYNPGDFVCRKGDIGKEMYIVKRGKLVVVSEDCKIVFVTLQQGAYFGEISILNIPGNKTGNRRTANVKSLGYSDLFCLTKQDLWDVLGEYPATKKALVEKGEFLLRKDNLLIEDESVVNKIIVDEDNYESLSVKRKLDLLETTFDNLEKKLTLLTNQLNLSIKTMKSDLSYLDNGLLVVDGLLIAKRKLKSVQFYMISILSTIPYELIVNAILPWLNFLPILRLNRLLKINRIFEFRDKTETATNYPNAFRIFSLLLTIVVIIHWNACFYFLISKYIGLSSDNWVYNATGIAANDFINHYAGCFFWSTLALTTISNINVAETPLEMVYITMNYLIGILIFAAIVGSVTEILSNLSAQRSAFQQTVDAVKSYMQLRKVNKDLQKRVIKWFEYSWSNSQGLDENVVMKQLLPENLEAELSINVHLETLKRVHIFQDCEPGLLQELVTKLKLQMFSPSDFICRKGDIGREMYFIKRGKLCVVSDDGKTIFATLSEGSYFGEISILDIPGSKTGNRRTANVVSVGYSDLFCLTKTDLWKALSEYPLAKKTLIEKGKALLRKDNLLDEEVFEETEKQQVLNQMVEDKLIQLKIKFDSIETRLARLIGELPVNIAKLEKRKIAIHEQLSAVESTIIE